MGDDDYHEMVRRMQDRSEAMKRGPIPLLIPTGPGPYQLPLCIHASVGTWDSDMAQLILDTANEKRILVPLSVDLLRSLAGAISTSLKTSED